MLIDITVFVSCMYSTSYFGCLWTLMNPIHDYSDVRFLSYASLYVVLILCLGTKFFFWQNYGSALEYITTQGERKVSLTVSFSHAA